MAKIPQIDPAALPESLRDLVDVIGLAATLKLVERWGGVRVWVPARVERADELTMVLGGAAARRLASHVRGDYIAVPRCVQAVRAVRDAEIRRRYRDETAAALARDYAMTERMVWNIVRRGDPDISQGELFDC